MFIEKKRKGIPPRTLTSNGTSSGIITVSTVEDLFVKQKIQIISNTQPSLTVEINRFISPTQFVVGLPGRGINHKADLSDYLVADNARISAEEQDRPGIPDKDYNRASYMEEPVVAHRTISVDPYGGMYGPNNPMPVFTPGLAPQNFDEVDIIRDMEGDPTQYIFKLNGIQVGAIDVSYDACKASISYKKS